VNGATRFFSKNDFRLYRYCFARENRIFPRSRIVIHPKTAYVEAMVFSSENGFAVTLPPAGISADFHDPPPCKGNPRASFPPPPFPPLETSCACTQSISLTLILYYTFCCYLYCQTRVSRDIHCE